MLGFFSIKFQCVKFVLISKIIVEILALPLDKGNNLCTGVPKVEMEI